MSAWELDAVHIDALISAGLYGLRGGDRMYWYVGDEFAELTRQTADRVGAMLVAENRRSVNHRYEEDELEFVYTYRPVPGVPDPVVVLKLIACYEYQSREDDTAWASSGARAFCQALRVRTIGRLPGYDKAPWVLVEDADEREGSPIRGRRVFSAMVRRGRAGG